MIRQSTPPGNESVGTQLRVWDVLGAEMIPIKLITLSKQPENKLEVRPAQLAIRTTTFTTQMHPNDPRG